MCRNEVEVTLTKGQTRGQFLTSTQVDLRSVDEEKRKCRRKSQGYNMKGMIGVQ
jgi:hypothetical protein